MTELPTWFVAVLIVFAAIGVNAAVYLLTIGCWHLCQFVKARTAYYEANRKAEEKA